MPRLRFRDRFFTPPVARAVTSPSGILAAGVGAAVGIVALGPLGALAGLVAYAVRVAVAVPRQQGGERIDPFALGEPWRQFVKQALQARTRFAASLRTMRPGPLQDHLGEIGSRLDEAVDECWRVARRGQLLADARSQVEDGEARRQLAQLEARTGGSVIEGTTQARTAEALQAQLATARRMDAVLVDTHSRLQLLDARMDETVTRAIELSVQADSPADLGGLGQDVDGIVSEMEALRQALDEAGRRQDFPDLGSTGADQPAAGPAPGPRPGTVPGQSTPGAPPADGPRSG